MSKKKKNTNKEKEIEKNEDDVQETEDMTADVKESAEVPEEAASQYEAKEPQEDAAEDIDEAPQDDDASSEEPADNEETDNEASDNNASGEKPRKKERKLKWAAKDDEKSAQLEEKLKEANDKYVRLFAEFDNFRNRSEKEKAQRYDFGVRDMVERILPVIDNFERGLAAVPEDGSEDSFVTGMEMTYKQLMKVLEDAGVKPIQAVGEEFNPDFHNAVMHIEDPEAGDNIIVEEFQKGYTYKDHVVRYSMVKVAN